jgi:hypothetical protein
MLTLEIRKLKSELSAAKQINFNNSLIIKQFDSKNILLEEKNKSLLEENQLLEDKNKSLLEEKNKSLLEENQLLEDKNKSLLVENKSLREKNNWSSINKKNYKMNQIYKQFNIFEKFKKCCNELNGKTIINVYQPIYRYNNSIKYASGFGDFLRGCYFLLVFTANTNINIKFCINHTLKKWLKYNSSLLFNNNKNDKSNIITDCLHLDRINNWKSSIYDKNNIIKGNNYNPSDIDVFLTKLINYNHYANSDFVYLYTVLYPMNDIHTIHKKMMIDVLEPSDEMKNDLSDLLFNLKLEKYSYNIIHLRIGDDHIKNEKSINKSSSLVIKIITEINKFINNDQKYFIISDCNSIKSIITDEFNNYNIFVLNLPISHFGEGTLNDEIAIKNNMIDFYIMSYSCNIHSFSCYPHGSGFSLWCALTYDIPYNCMYISEN